MTLYSTIWCDEKPGLPLDMHVLHRERIGRRGVFRKVRRLVAGDAILLNGALGARDLWFDMLLAIYIRWFRRGVGVLMADATWHARALPGDSRAGVLFPAYALLHRVLLLLSRGRHTHYGFLSTAEVALVAREAALRPGVAHFTAFCSQLPLEILDELRSLCAQTEASAGHRRPRVFSGGNALRDYPSLIEAATGLDADIEIATTKDLGPLPPNVRAAGRSHHDFFRDMARSDIVVLPMWHTEGRSVGQQTYLNALALGKPLIVSDVIGVRDHLVGDLHALIVPSHDPAALREAMARMLAPAHRTARATMAQNGLALASEMTFAHYAARLSTLLREIQSQLPLQTGPTPHINASA